MAKPDIKGIGRLFRQAFDSFFDYKVLKLSASLAYYTVFSIGPMIIIIIYFAGVVYGQDAVQGTVFDELKGLIGTDAAAQIQSMIKNVALETKSNFAAVIGFITLFIGATGVFAEIQDSINDIWGLKPKPERGWLKMIVNRLLSFSVVVTLGFILLVSLIINGIIETLMDRLQTRFPNLTVVMVYVINLLITFTVVTTLFAIVFKVLPDAIIKWRDVMVGAMVTSVLFMLGKFGITLYISKSAVGTTYGAAGSLVILLLWVYYSSVILYFGAAFTKAYATDFGSHIRPSQYAVWVKHVEVEEGKATLKQQEQKKKDENEQTGDHVKVT